MTSNPIPELNLSTQEALNIGIKLRESCDSCLTAKVKCEKGRPVCLRCLTKGSDCQYSPSARAGRKPRNNETTKPENDPPPPSRPASADVSSNAPFSSGSSSSTWTPQFMPYHQDHSMLDINSYTADAPLSSGSNLSSWTPQFEPYQQDQSMLDINNYTPTFDYNNAQMFYSDTLAVPQFTNFEETSFPEPRPTSSRASAPNWAFAASAKPNGSS